VAENSEIIEIPKMIYRPTVELAVDVV